MALKATSPIRALPDSAPQPEGERIPYTCPEGSRLLVWVETVIANAEGRCSGGGETFITTRKDTMYPQSPFPDKQSFPVKPGTTPPRYQTLERGARKALYVFLYFEKGEAIYTFDRMIDAVPEWW